MLTTTLYPTYMRISPQAEVQILHKKKILGKEAYDICKKMELVTISDIVRIPISYIIQRFRYCTDHTLVQFASLHKVFTDYDSIVTLKEISSARKVGIAGKKALVKEYYDHSANISTTSDDTTGTVESDFYPQIEEILAILEKDYGFETIKDFRSNFPDIAFFMKELTKNDYEIFSNIEASSVLRKSAVRRMSVELLGQSAKIDYIPYNTRAILEESSTKLASWSSYFYALDLYNDMDKDSKRNLIEMRDDILDEFHYSAEKSDYNIENIISDLKALYGPEKPRRPRSRSWYEQFLKKFKLGFENFTLNTQVNLTDAANREEVRRKLEKEHQYLYPEECDQIVRILSSGRPMPMLLMFIKRFARINDRDVAIRRDYCGLNDTFHRMNLDELSVKYNLRPERLRTILGKRGFFYSSYHRLLQDYLNIEDDVVGVDNPRLLQLIEENELEMTPTQVLGILLSVYQFSELITLTNGKMYFLKNQFSSLIRFQGYYSKIESHLKKERQIPLELDYSRQFFLGERIQDKQRMAAQASKVFEDAFSDNPNFRVDGPLRYTIMPNKVNRNAEIERILAEHGEPMSGKEIYDRYKSLYPDEPEISISTFKTSIQSIDSIVAKGRTGMYIMKSWKGHYTGTLTELLFETLSESAEPLTLSELTEKALIHFPTTSRRSVETLLKREIPNRFIAFHDDMYGSSTRKYSRKYKKKITA